MVRFITGDSLGNLKAASYNADKICLVETLQGGVKSEPPVAIQKLAAAQINGSTMVCIRLTHIFTFSQLYQARLLPATLMDLLLRTLWRTTHYTKRRPGQTPVSNLEKPSSVWR